MMTIHPELLEAVSLLGGAAAVGLMAVGVNLLNRTLLGGLLLAGCGGIGMYLVMTHQLFVSR